MKEVKLDYKIEGNEDAHVIFNIGDRITWNQKHKLISNQLDLYYKIYLREKMK